jgi:hypothetical protein
MSTYTKTTWATGDVATAAKMNNAETGVESAHSELASHEANTANPHGVTATQAGAIGDGNGTRILYTGHVGSTGTGYGLPSGWTATRTSTGTYTVTHNLGLADTRDLVIQLTMNAATGRNSSIDVLSMTANAFTVSTNEDDLAADTAFFFSAVN